MPPRITPISVGEFFQCLQKCIPPSGWPNKIAVANSAGPDSTCLLFLLAQVLKGNTTGYMDGRPVMFYSGLPSDLVSLHIFHNLQEANIDMANVAKANANVLNVRHLDIKIPWGQKLWPEKPGKGGQPLEEAARRARYQRLSAGMTMTRSEVLAVAHHADDQVETAVMRMSMGSGDMGLAGMRPIRRWGMNQNEFGHFAAHAGMSRWIVRPLQWFSKDRILATCDAHGLEFVVDPTNFEPFLGIRNYIRHHLQEDKISPGSRQTVKQKQPSSLTPELQAQMQRVDQCLPMLKGTAGEMPTNVPLTSDETLREYVCRIGEERDRLDIRVSNALEAAILPSPPSTLLLSFKKLSKVQSPSVRVGLCRRILRSISPRPWGDLAAEAKGDNAALQNMADMLWSTEKARQKWIMKQSGTNRVAFTAPSTVQCTPLYLEDNGSVAPRDSETASRKREPVWLFQRAVPHETTLRARQGRANPLEKDITKLFRQHSDSINHTLYDCRFLITYSQTDIPERVARAVAEGAQVLVRPDTAWFWPQVVLKLADGSEEVLARVRYEHKSWARWTRPKEGKLGANTNIMEGSASKDNWISIQFIRSRDAL